MCLPDIGLSQIPGQDQSKSPADEPANPSQSIRKERLNTALQATTGTGRGITSVGIVVITENKWDSSASGSNGKDWRP